jgi:hypothetical protein
MYLRERRRGRVSIFAVRVREDREENGKIKK